MSEQPPPGWYADPTSRYEHRYWDGGTWTEHVSRNGQATTDPLDGSAPPSGGETSGIATGGVAQGAGTSTWQGTSAGSWQDTAATTRTNSKAILSLVLSVIWVGGLASIVAIVLGVMARREIRERPDEGGAGMATAGIVIGVIGVAGALLMLVLVLSFVAFGDGMGPMAP